MVDRADAVPVLAHLPLEAGCSVVHDGDAVIVALTPDVVRTASGAAAFAALDDAARAGFWVVSVAYDLGRSIERIEPRAADDLGLPDVMLARFDARLVLRPGHEPEVVGTGQTADTLARAAWRARRGGEPRFRPLRGRWTTSLDRAAHAAAVESVLELLRAGDCYQVNVTRRLTNATPAEPAALFATLARANPAPHAALLTTPDVALVCSSPELFLHVDDRGVVTRPIKGTGIHPERLAASAKDRAENVMIVDLARNDLGRVCEYGSISVSELCSVETHPGLYHLVSTVRGQLRADLGFADLVRATFPPASVTGAPKPRVLQAIEDLEPVRRGAYCGAIGWIDGDARRAELAVAIRTFTITASGTHFGVGGGIVADSRPDAEWAETELKSARLIGAASQAPVGVPTSVTNRR
ncbi:MAG: anthranilate synthase component I family protein [Actinomycetota bacterium]